MADTRELPVFAYIDDVKQLQELRQYLNKHDSVKLDPNGPSETAQNMIEICSTLNVLPSWSQDVDLVLNSISSLIVVVPGEKCEPVVDSFIKNVAPQFYKGTGWASHAGIAVRVLSNLYKGYSNFHTVQEKIFKALVDMCAEARLIGELECNLETLQDRFNTWKTPVEGQREILRAVHRALLVDQRVDQAAKVMTALLGTYTEKDAAAARDDAMECVRTAVVDPKSFSFDHLERLSAVKALKTSDPLMFTALELFISGTLKDYKEFVAKNPKFVTEHLKVDETILLKKIRLLTLMSLAEEKNEISLDELAKQLDILADETLEEFVIDAIQVNAISGKINEMARTLIVSSYQHRRFGTEQWVLLEKRLKVLIANLKQTHNNVHEVNQRIEAL
ncbi:COP9/Signalosome and eIF3 complex-shared subunit 1 [Caenorhabditis elegans]|uniref:COP9/Signalosome and eIF3 complex-shared subunit 1 n=1 Tax=Caenorhabditis elegans TaxID=6239 RepID=EIF3M_CAEEL|nr:COP9/Signalosome and eIF3 complex-shared subunit 1 [Caenorhabditis elegans]Q94261.1 RecName: Full=COP9/Signalosome and eIF3 complex-shared subunit 1; AltName: Full=COP9 signalosome complex subunit 7; Short=Signalosome subunit 7; AltName: Full=Eukaryotic translation initiation factor 3 subunit M; Short=eIF3m [Caenorhabditis elegans]CCD68723.1 COP9/Signalosome and eIF3 complex-shared subunit 1 [Caenorhabditis elegans]|eukprot:NP_500618.1 COP9/Signalosome and eIF3 complex-shared subunit 1 [Caenorhabditis elegans]